MIRRRDFITLAGGAAGGYIVPKRFDQVSERFSDESVVIDNGNHGVLPIYDPNQLIAEIARGYHCTNVMFP